MVPHMNFDEQALNRFHDFNPVTEETIHSYIDMLHSNAIGADGISARSIKIVKNSIADILAFLINLSFSQGIFPDKLKIARVLILYKKDNKNDPGNYRPISI